MHKWILLYKLYKLSNLSRVSTAKGPRLVVVWLSVCDTMSLMLLMPGIDAKTCGLVCFARKSWGNFAFPRFHVTARRLWKLWSSNFSVAVLNGLTAGELGDSFTLRTPDEEALETRNWCREPEVVSPSKATVRVNLGLCTLMGHPCYATSYLPKQHHVVT